MSRDTIETLYTSLRKLDGAAMAACYATDARFQDPVFTLQGRERVGGMWRMLADAVLTKGKDVWRVDFSQVTDTSAHWEAHYRFSATGRPVHNIMESRFEFDKAGLIVNQIDHFDFWRWSRQALGTPGVLLGWTPMLHNKVRAQAAANLDKYLAR